MLYIIQLLKKVVLVTPMIDNNGYGHRMSLQSCQVRALTGLFFFSRDFSGLRGY